MSEVRAHLFRNHWLWASVAISLVLQVVVIYVPWLQRAFGSLSAGDWLFCTVIASSVLWLREVNKLVRALTAHTRGVEGAAARHS